MSLFKFPQPRIFTTPPLSIVDTPAAHTHFLEGRLGFQPLFINVHHTGGFIPSTLNWLRYASNPRVSTHRLIGRDGTNYKVVQDEDTAYCAGFATIGPIDADISDPAGVPINNNVCSLNIEIEHSGNPRDSYPLPQMVMVAKQIVEWWGKYGFLPVLAHGQIDANKNDPAGFDWALLHRLLRDELTKVLAVV